MGILALIKYGNLKMTGSKTPRWLHDTWRGYEILAYKFVQEHSLPTQKSWQKSVKVSGVYHGWRTQEHVSMPWSNERIKRHWKLHKEESKSNKVSKITYSRFSTGGRNINSNLPIAYSAICVRKNRLRVLNYHFRLLLQTCWLRSARMG